VTATVDLEEVRSYRAAISRGLQAATNNARYQRIQTPFDLSSEEDDADISKRPTLPIQPRIHSVEEEIALSAGCYLWDVGASNAKSLRCRRLTTTRSISEDLARQVISYP
jgi:NAD+ synthase (glutamine-hydrolysing)